MRTPALPIARLAAAILAVALLATACGDPGAEARKFALERSAAVTFESSDGVELSGRLFGPENARAGVVLAHMLPADQTSWYEFAGRLGSQGYRAITFDFRGYCPGGDAGCSKGEKNVAAIWQDVEGAVAFLRSEGVQRVALVGASMGGTASLVVAGSQMDEVDAVVTLSAPASIQGLTAGTEVMQTVTAAKLFLAGNADGAAADVAQNFFNTSLQPKRVEILTTDDHGTDMLTGNQAEIARNLILGWLAQHLPADG